MAPTKIVAIAKIKYEPQVGSPYSAIKVECKTLKTLIKKNINFLKRICYNYIVYRMI